MLTVQSLVVLGHVYVFGILPNHLSTINQSLNQSIPNSTGIPIPTITESPIRPALTSTEISTTPAPRLRSDYTYTPGVGAHKVYTNRLNWNDARLYCEEEGAHLIIINSRAEMEAIGKLMKNSRISYSWVGAHDFYKEGQFVTIHGESLEKAGFAEWYRGEPNSWGGNENCLIVKNQLEVYELHDVSCSSNFEFTCELLL